MSSTKLRATSSLPADPAIAELLRGSVENRAALTRKQKRDRARSKATYDLPPGLQRAVAAVARREDTSSSQVVALCLAYALAAYVGEEPGLMAGLSQRRPARTPRFSWNLEMPEAWQAAVAGLSQEGGEESLPPAWQGR